ncbi:hypothetical protein HY415_01265 [Candidatus Kaiserbacteria bacterium]|nr:hypothetical protein [Candidatus Kaiserbacteria bacterium]
MTHLILILAALALLGSFIALTDYEMRRGVRFFALRRAQFDQHIEQVKFVLTHVNFGAFLRDEMRRIADRAGHDIAHLSLQAVRMAERLLTRLVRYFRSRHAVDTVPGENVREFVKTLSDFKVKLKETRSEMTEIQ